MSIHVCMCAQKMLSIFLFSPLSSVILHAAFLLPIVDCFTYFGSLFVFIYLFFCHIICHILLVWSEANVTKINISRIGLRLKICYSGTFNSVR